MKRMTFAGVMLMSAAFLGGCSKDDSNGGGAGAGGAKAGGTGGTRTGGSGGGGSGGSSATGGTGGGSSATGGSSGTGGSGTGGAGAGTGGGGGAGTGGAGTDAGTGTGGGGGGGTGGAGGGDTASGETGGGSTTMSFFVTSVGAGMGGDLGGLAGADAKCKALATAVSAELGAKTWKAYLSTSMENARDRIGKGPWRNSKGEIIANDVAQLHDQAADGMLNATWPQGAGALAKILDEKGGQVPNNVHDILTGTNMAGMVDGTNHCNNWTAVTGMATVGHSNRSGGGRPPSWTTAHTAGCAALGSGGGNVGSGGGKGAIYCFAAN